MKAHRRELVDPKIREHHGHIVKTTGDGLLAEFASVVDAVRCAAEIQRGMIDREPGVPGERRIRFRIGVNLGDIIAEGGDIFGDGVNVAARLEALAAPGGICVSRTVRDHIRDKLPFPFEDRGEQSVKNIARPVRVYAFGREAVAALPATGALAGTPPRRQRRISAIAAAALAALVMTAGGWWLWPTTKIPPATMAAGTIALPLAAPRMSIVVLPFGNLNNDPEQQYFVDGITEDLTTDPSRIAGMFVISRNTAFTYRNKVIDTKQIGRELGVRYVVEGSVRRLANQLRVTAQLIDAETNAHLWAERFDRDIGDLFAPQNEITSRIANTLKFELFSAEAARPTADPDALDYILRGRAAARNGPSRENHADVVRLFERALALDPRSVYTQTSLANALRDRARERLTDSRAADIERAEGLVRQALEISPSNPLVHFAKGQLLRTQRRCEDAIPEYGMVLESDRNRAVALFSLGICNVLVGSVNEAIPLLQQSIRLDPRNPSLVYRYDWLGVAHLLDSRTHEAINWFEKARSVNPGIALPHAHLAAAYGLTDETKRAAAELAEAQKLSGDNTYSSIAQLAVAQYLGAPKTRALFEATYFAGLRLARMPGE